MKINSVLRIYMVAFTSFIGLISVFTLFDYVFVPTIPFFYLLTLPFYLCQFVLFSKYHQDNFILQLYKINVVICCFLLWGTKTLVGTQYFALYQLTLVLGNCKNYHRILPTAGSTSVLIIGRIVVIARSMNLSIMLTTCALLLSSVLTISSIFKPYPPIQLENNMIKFGVSQNSDFVDSDFFMVDRSIDIGCGKIVKIGMFYFDYA